MSHKKWNRAATVFVVVMVAASTVSLAGNPKMRPFKGSLSGEATFPLNEECLEVTGAQWQTLSETDGKMNHLGRTHLSTAHCSTLDGTAAVAGVATFTAANGDEVWATYTATTIAPPPLIVQQSEFVIVGGTGRFENAAGQLVGMVYVTYEGESDPSWPLEFVLAGTISY